MQAEHACEAEPVPPNPACPSPGRPRPKPNTPEEAETLEQLRRFQTDLGIGGVVDASTVREVLKIVGSADLPSALRLVADKLWERRRRDPSYRKRVDFGFVLIVLRQDWSISPTRPIHSPIPAPELAVLSQEGISGALPSPEAMSGPRRYREPPPASRNESRDGFRQAGDLLRAAGVLDLLNEP